MSPNGAITSVDNRQGDDLAFIVGHYKSGSTWLVNALSLHPQIRGVGETHVFRLSATSKDFCRVTDTLFRDTAWGNAGNTSMLRYRLGDLIRPMRFWKPTLCVKNRPATRFDLTRKEQAALRRELETSMCADEFCRRLFHCLRQALKPDRYLVEKTPTNVFEVPRIHEIYPRAKLLAIVRDGRDVVVSEKFMLANLKRGITFRERVLAWRKAMEAHLKYEKDFGLYTFSYRQFLENGVGTLRGLLDFMGLVSFPDLLLDVQRRSSFEFITGRKNGHERSKEFFRKGIHGDWVNHFTTDEKKVFKDLAGDMLVRLGFESNNNW